MLFVVCLGVAVAGALFVVCCLVVAVCCLVFALGCLLFVCC